MKFAVIGIMASAALVGNVQADAVSAAVDRFEGASDQTVLRALRQGMNTELQTQHNLCMSRVANATPDYTIKGCQKLYRDTEKEMTTAINAIMAERKRRAEVKAATPITTDDVVADYSQRINQAVVGYVQYQSNAYGKNLSCRVTVTTDKGTVTNVTGEGADEVCVPAIKAVKAGSPLPYPSEHPEAAKSFDEFVMNFKPNF